MRPLMRQFAIFIFQFSEPLAKLRIAETTRQSDIKNLSVFDGLFFKLSSTTSFARGSPNSTALLANKFYGQAKGLISTGQLSTLLRLHFQPINVVVYHES